MSPDGSIRVLVNGEPLRLREPISLLALLEQLDEPYAHALVERNRRLVRPEQLAGTMLADGDEIEVILPAFGG